MTCHRERTQVLRPLAGCRPLPNPPCSLFVLPARRCSTSRCLLCVQSDCGGSPPPEPYFHPKLASQTQQQYIMASPTGDSCAGAPFAGWLSAAREGVRGGVTSLDFSDLGVPDRFPRTRRTERGHNNVKRHELCRETSKIGLACK